MYTIHREAEERMGNEIETKLCSCVTKFIQVLHISSTTKLFAGVSYFQYSVEMTPIHAGEIHIET